MDFKGFAAFQYVRAGMNHVRANQVSEIPGHFADDQQFGPFFEVGLRVHTKMADVTRRVLWFRFLVP